MAQQRERGKDTIITVALETQDGTGRECLRSLTLADCQGFGDRRRSDGDHAILQLRRNRQAAKTLRAISDVFDAITSSRLVPHRHSMFTDLLKESLGGSTVTYWIANFSTADACLNETMVTLQLVSAAQGVENEAPCMDLQDIFEPVRPAKEFALKDCTAFHAGLLLRSLSFTLNWLVDINPPVLPTSKLHVAPPLKTSPMLFSPPWLEAWLPWPGCALAAGQVDALLVHGLCQLSGSALRACHAELERAWCKMHQAVEPENAALCGRQQAPGVRLLC